MLHLTKEAFAAFFVEAPLNQIFISLRADPAMGLRAG